MVKKIRFQELRPGRRRHRAPRGTWILEPVDTAVIGLALAVVLWLQWISPTS
jgi:hypothetical protein